MASDSEEAPFARAVLITLAVLALYVLSLGPIARATGEGQRWVLVAYYPLAWAAAHCEPVNKALDWYVNLWLPPEIPRPSPTSVSN